ncbi:DUF5667 domain-containing protein [Salirhabdus salicampi]|nr:DUF5667 domain-containing protein [Salirhabdus salicampi]
MFIQKHELKKDGDVYDIILYIKPNEGLEEFSEELGKISESTGKDIDKIAIGYVKQRFSNLRVRGIKIMMGGVLISSVLIGGGMGPIFAEEDATEQPPTETVSEDEATSPESTPDETTTDPAEEDVTDETIVEETEDEVTESPGLLPDNFFYFVKVATEKIQLALTFDDVKQAQLLAEFAEKRVAEANALIEKGNTELAAESLAKALESQELALDYSDRATDEKVADSPTSDVKRSLEDKITKNTSALLLAMEKVENPKAREALAKNVEKSFERMSKKLNKINELQEKIDKKKANGNDEDIEDLEDDLQELEEEIDEDQEEFEEEMNEVKEKENEHVKNEKKNKSNAKKEGKEERASGEKKGKEKGEKKNERKKEEEKEREYEKEEQHEEEEEHEEDDG